jgi:hypothetical protein
MTDDQDYGYEQYSNLANAYNYLRDRRAAYIEAVNKLVCKHLADRKRLLDIGSGDGVRISHILNKISVEQAILLEPCKEMAVQIRCARNCEIATIPIQEFELCQGYDADAVTMLWNVFGHIPSNDRLAVAKKIRSFLSPKGLLILDVNNRHNRSNYGFLRVACRRFIDWLLPDTRRGDSSFIWHQDGSKFTGKGHLFTPRELVNVFETAGFSIVCVLTVDYDTGLVSNSRHDGQLFAVFSR